MITFESYYEGAIIIDFKKRLETFDNIRVLHKEIHQHAQNARPHRNMTMTTESQFSSTVLLIITKLSLEWKAYITAVLKIVCGKFDAVLHLGI